MTMSDGYDFDIAQVGDRISYTEDGNRDLETDGELIHVSESEDYFEVGIDPDESRFDYYWVIPKAGERAFDYTVELEEWDDA